MTLEEIFYVSQSVASIAVVGSLIYLGLQVRYAERSQRGIMQQGRADRTSQNSLALADPVLARIWQKGAAGDTDLTPLEFTQWMLICRSAFLSGEDSFMQHKAGLLAPAAYESYVAGARFYLVTPGVRAAWKLTREQFGSEFRSFVDATVTELANAPPRPDAFAEWKKLVAKDDAGS